MKFVRLFLPLGAFAAAALVVRFWPGDSGPAAADLTPAAAPAFPTSGTSGAAPGKTTGPAFATRPQFASSGAFARAAPTMDEVFGATDLDRMLLMARFIQTASAEELKAVIDRTDEDEIFDTTFADQAWLRWVELDLEGALRHHRPANGWWACAKLNPQAALSRSLETGPPFLTMVLRSIGQSDPVWARKLLAEHPVIDEDYVLRGVLEGLEKATLPQPPPWPWRKVETIWKCNSTIGWSAIRSRRSLGCAA